jgi:two-component system, LytTR family, sensor kinase
VKFLKTPKKIFLFSPSKMTQQLDFEAISQQVGRFIFTDLQKATALLDQLEAAKLAHFSENAQANYHFLRGQLLNETYQFHDAATHFKTSIFLFEKIKNPAKAVETRLELAAVLTNLRAWEATEIELEIARNFLKKNKLPRLAVRLKLRDAFLRLQEGNQEKAIAQLLDCEQVVQSFSPSDEPADLAFQTRIQSGLFEVFLKNKDFEKAVEAILRVLNLAEKHGLHTRISWHYLNAGRTFFSLGNSERAAYFFQKAVETTDDVSREVRASATANWGFLEFANGRIAEAHQKFDRARELFGTPQKPADFINLSLVEMWDAQAFIVEENAEKAEFHFEKALESAFSGENLLNAADISRSVATYFSQKNDFEQAYFYSKNADELFREHTKNARDEQISEISIRYDAENRRREAELARSQAVGLQLRALRAQMNPHFIFNALNAVHALLLKNENAEATDWLIRFSRLMRQTLELSNSETISLEAEIEFLEKYLEVNQKLRFREKLTFKIDIDDDLETDLIQIPSMIIQPYIENAIEHGINPRGGGHISIFFREKEAENCLICVIEDDGYGIREINRRQKDAAESNKHRSRGREITEERLHLLHRSAGRRVGEWVKTDDLSDLFSEKKTGTRVEILIPILE